MSRCDTCYWCDTCAERCRGYRRAEPEPEQDNQEEEKKP